MPLHTISAFKLFRQRKDGSLGPLFINRSQRLEFDTWYDAEEHKTKGYAFRPGWHCTIDPIAPHLSQKDRIWCKVLLQDVKTYTRPINQGGIWLLANRMKIESVYENF